jgi:anaerobic dimethyl sulfoxide reductase subunit B (iron-sulfur subunit)
MSVEYGISYNEENCIQCHGCEVACKSWRGVELGVSWRRVVNLWQGRYPDLKNIPASIACMHCSDPVCVQACPGGAIYKRPEDGIVLVDRDKCKGCRSCLEACPFDVPQFGDDGIMQKCNMCVDEIDFNTDSPPCVETCPTKSLSFVRTNSRGKAEMEESLKHLIMDR